MDSQKPPNIITLLTDFGDADIYAGVLRGVILAKNPQAHIVDLTHNVLPQHIEQAAWMLADGYSFFPKKTVHLAIVDPGVGTSRKIVASEVNGHYFVAPDNGILTAVWNTAHADHTVSVTNQAHSLDSISPTFHGRDIMAPLASILAMGEILESIGSVLPDPVRLTLPEIKTELTGTLEGQILYSDHFGNLVTNISPRQVPDQISIEIQEQVIHKVVNTYAEAPRGTLLGVVGSTGRLEIAVNAGSARDLLQVDPGHTFTLKCERDQN